MKALLGLIAAGGASAALAQSPLPAFHVDSQGVTVAGISSGGFMAVQLDVAYSSRFHGAAVFAGGPYGCAQGSVNQALGACTSGMGLVVQPLIDATHSAANAGTIDPVANLSGQPVYLFSGTLDTTVHPPVMDALQQYYQAFTSASGITYDNGTAAAHAWISPDGPNACSSSYIPYINNCSKDPEQSFLGQFYGTLAPRNGGTLGGALVQFDQTPYCPGGCAAASLDSTAWLFVPQACAAGATCRLIVALHGCLQYQGVIQQAFVQKSGLLEWADTNDLLVLYPQTTTSANNPEGCWDWWGYSGADYALKSGVQMRAVIAMVDQLSSGGGTDAGNPTPDAGPGMDAGADAGSAAGGDAGAGTDAGGHGGSAGGCGCTGSGARSYGWLAGLALLVYNRRRCASGTRFTAS